MKKLLLSMMAVAAMVSCVKEQVVATKELKAISFGNFVQNRAAIDPSFNNDTQKVTAFYVWGFMTSPTGVVFDQELVEYNETEGAWKYSNLAYWAPSKSYKFAALAPVKNDKVQVALATDGKYMSANGVLGTVTFENVDGTVDVIYAEDSVDTPTTIADDPEKVELTFQHLLSKIKFTFTNGLPNEYQTMTISDVKMVVPAKGVVDLATKPYVWALTENATTTLDFGQAIDKKDETNNKLAVAGVGEVEHERLTIPIATTETLITSYTVSFNVTLYNGTEDAQVVPMTSTIKGTTLEAGKCYNFTATLTADKLGLKPIDFEVVVEDWIEAGDLGFLN